MFDKSDWADKTKGFTCKEFFEKNPDCSDEDAAFDGLEEGEVKIILTNASLEKFYNESLKGNSFINADSFKMFTRGIIANVDGRLCFCIIPMDVIVSYIKDEEYFTLSEEEEKIFGDQLKEIYTDWCEDSGSDAPKRFHDMIESIKCKQQ